MFLDPAARAAQSVWGFVTAAEQEEAVDRLRADLDSGAWQQQYGRWRDEPFFEGSLVLVVNYPDA
jgi:hypothetical protein